MARPADARKDQDLINILMTNARTSISDIAKALGVSRATAQERMARLEKQGTIAGYTAILGKEEHITSISAIISIELEGKKQGNVIAALRKKAEVVNCYTLSGPFDLLVKVTCTTPVHLDEIIDSIAEIEGVKSTTSSILLARKFER